MADQKISALDAKATLAGADMLPLVDEEATPDQTKKITWANVLAQIRAAILENPPTEDESSKAPTSEWAFDHNADTDAHHAQAHTASHTDGTDDIQDAAADDSTKGISTFEADDFDSASGKIDLATHVVKQITADSGIVIPLTHNFSVQGGEGIDTSASATQLVIKGEDASDTNKGIAKFDIQHFTVASGAVDLKIDDTPVNGETDEPITSNWAFAHNAAVLSHLVHDNDNYFLGYYDETIVDPTTGQWVRPRSLVAIDDPSSGLDTSDWYGASGAYEQADADSDATHIEDDSANFPNSIRWTVVYWASNAAGDADTGIGLVQGVASDTLTIIKFTGANFAANYYYWIKHDEWVVPVTGIYSVKGTVTFYPDEADKWFAATVDAYAGVVAGTTVVGGIGTAAVAYYSQPTAVGIVSLTAGQHVYLNSAHNGSPGVDIYRLNSTHLPLQIWLLKQTA